MITVGDLLELDLLEGTVVLAGASGLGLSVAGIHVLEGPDRFEDVRAHELAVTSRPPGTGDVVALVRGLAEGKASGLGVRPTGALPPELLAEADALDLPVIALPDDLAFGDLAREVYALLHQRSDRLHSALSQIVLEGGDLAGIAAETARVLDVGVLVTSTDGRERAASLPEDIRTRLAEVGMLDETGRVRVERAGRAPLPFGDGEIRTFRVAGAGSDLARLVCVSPDRPIGPDDVHALERATTVAALVVTRQAAVAAIENKYQGDFLRDVFLNRAGDADFVIEHAATFGWDLERPMVVLSAEIDPTDEDVSARVRREWQERFAAAWRQVCAAHDRCAPSVDFSTEVVSVLAAGDGLRERVARVVSDVAGDRGGGRRPFSVGVSRVATLADLPAAYSQARRAATVGRRVNGPKSTTWFDDLGLHRLLALVPDDGEISEFVGDVLGELAADTPEAADLRTTLQVLLDTNLNVAEAARLQFFHYNTMRYRVSKLERILGPFTSDPHLRLNVSVALQVLEMKN